MACTLVATVAFLATARYRNFGGGMRELRRPPFLTVTWGPADHFHLTEGFVALRDRGVQMPGHVVELGLPLSSSRVHVRFLSWNWLKETYVAWRSNRAGSGLITLERAAEVQEQILAVAWGDGREGRAFYGAYVYAAPGSEGFTVSALVKLGRGTGAFYDCGELGRVDTREEAVARWGNIEWRADGLHIGEYFLARAKVENRR